jgi:hypothetical protein
LLSPLFDTRKVANSARACFRFQLVSETSADTRDYPRLTAHLQSVYYYRMTKTPQPSGIARIASLFTAAGFLGGPIDGSSVSAPETIKLVGDHLVWSAEGTVRKIEVGDMLERFLALETPERGNQDVFNFARDFGPLWLCQDHGFVAFHQPIETIDCALMPETSNAPSRSAFRPLPGVAPMCLPRLAQKSPDLYSESQSQWSRAAVLFSEPVSQWRKRAANANRLLDAAATLQRGNKVDAETWRQIDGLAPDHPIAKHLSDPRARLAENLNRWLAIADVRFHVGIEGRNIRPQLGANRYTGSVLALIALELVAATVRAAALARCSSCSRLFFMSASQPTPGKRIGHATARRIYCSTCRAARIPARDAAQAARDRKKAAAAAYKSDKGAIR